MNYADDPLPLLKALASRPRLNILRWLTEPTQHFPEQTGGDRVEDGVCVDYIRDKLGVSAPTASRHLQILTRVGLVRPKRIGRWTYYKRVEPAVDEARRRLGAALGEEVP